MGSAGSPVQDPFPLFLINKESAPLDTVFPSFSVPCGGTVPSRSSRGGHGTRAWPNSTMTAILEAVRQCSSVRL